MQPILWLGITLVMQDFLPARQITQNCSEDASWQSRKNSDDKPHNCVAVSLAGLLEQTARPNNTERNDRRDDNAGKDRRQRVACPTPREETKQRINQKKQHKNAAMMPNQY
jgi:hypothetical protein